MMPWTSLSLSWSKVTRVDDGHTKLIFAHGATRAPESANDVHDWHELY